MANPPEQKSEERYLVVNSGSSSIKFAIFFGHALTRSISGSVTEIGGHSRLNFSEGTIERRFTDHYSALAGIFEHLESMDIELAALRAVAHRIVHGGPDLSRTVRITDTVFHEIEKCCALAPLHNPHNLLGISAISRLYPDLPQYACFDTAFHRTNPEVAYRFALPSIPETIGFRRYGFHGISYQGLVNAIAACSNSKLPSRLLAMHLGNGASLCAIKDGQSVATTMGYSPLDGLTMGTRCGSIDPTIVLELTFRVGTERSGVILNRHSGLLGLGGSSDMRELSQSGTPEAQFAVEHFCYWAIRHCGSMIAAMGGCDAIAFTGGIGENDAHVRKKIVNGLAFIGARLDQPANSAADERIESNSSQIPIWIIPANEERTMALEVLSVRKSETGS